jgi:hypothetical protein
MQSLSRYDVLELDRSHFVFCLSDCFLYPQQQVGKLFEHARKLLVFSGNIHTSTFLI